MKNCTGINCIMQLGKVDPATCPAVGYCQQATPPITNYDLLRAMSVEELAKWFCDMAVCQLCPIADCPGTRDCESRWIDWLKKETPDA